AASPRRAACRRSIPHVCTRRGPGRRAGGGLCRAARGAEGVAGAAPDEHVAAAAAGHRALLGEFVHDDHQRLAGLALDHLPNPVSFYMGTTQEPGAPGGGSTAIQVAVNSWDNDCASNVNYVYAGADDGTHTQGLHAADGRNTVLFE